MAPSIPVILDILPSGTRTLSVEVSVPVDPEGLSLRGPVKALLGQAC